MEDSITWVKTWEQLYQASPEAVESSRVHWYTVPGASRSGFHESALPDRRLFALKLSFTMCQLAMSEWYAHLDLDTLAEKAAAFIEERTDAAERKRVAEARLEGYDALKEAYAKGLDAVYALAGLADGEIKIAQWMMADTPDEVIADLMGYKTSGRTKNTDTVRNRKSRVLKKLQALITKEEV